MLVGETEVLKSIRLLLQSQQASTAVTLNRNNNTCLPHGERVKTNLDTTKQSGAKPYIQPRSDVASKKDIERPTHTHTKTTTTTTTTHTHYTHTKLFSRRSTKIVLKYNQRRMIVIMSKGHVNTVRYHSCRCVHA